MSIHAPAFSPRWRFAPLLLCHLAAALLWVSLAVEPGMSAWREIDRVAFFFMNSILGAGEWMQIAWAYMNTKAYDNTNGTIMVLFAGWLFWQMREKPAAGRMALFVLLAVTILAAVATSKTIFVDIDKLSPSLEYTRDFYVLRDLVPWVGAKTGSTQSFPADHGVVIFIYVAFFYFLTPRKYFLIALVLGVFNVSPRMVVGAHWLSDNIVGGGMFALIFLAWALATPALSWVETMIAWTFRRLGLTRFL